MLALAHSHVLSVSRRLCPVELGVHTNRFH
jgi:hypothetical protein